MCDRQSSGGIEKSVCIAQHVGNCDVVTDVKFPITYVHVELLNRELIIHILFSFLSTLKITN
jgi:hypothetical protein